MKVKVSIIHLPSKKVQSRDCSRETVPSVNLMTVFSTSEDETGLTKALLDRHRIEWFHPSSSAFRSFWNSMLGADLKLASSNPCFDSIFKFTILPIVLKFELMYYAKNITATHFMSG